MMRNEHVHGGGCVGVELPEIYDGVAYFICTDGKYRNAWLDSNRPKMQKRIDLYLEEHRRKLKAIRAMQTVVEGMDNG